MHNITFKKLTFSNFMSYGDSPNTVEFNNGLTYLNAANGYGKSAIIEALTFSLFGASYRGGNIGDLKNTENTTGDMRTSVEFDIDTGKEVHEYRIERALKAKAKSPVFKIFADGVEQSKKAGMSQSNFEHDILGFDIKLFKYVIAMNALQTTPFVEMPVPKKRELLEEVISLSTEKWKKCNNKALSDASINFDTVSKNIERIVKDIEYTTNMIDSLKSKKKNEVDNLIAQQQEKMNNRPALRKEYESCKERTDIELTALNNIKAKFNEVNEKSNELTRIYGEIDSWNNCVNIINDISAEYDEVSKNNALLKTALDNSNTFDVDNLKTRLDVVTAEINKCNSDIITSKSLISAGNIELSNLNREKEELQREASEQDKIAAEQKVGVPCPTCGKPSTEEDVARVIASIERVKEGLRNKWREKNNNAKSVTSRISSYNENIAANESMLDEKKKEYESIKVKIDEYNAYVAENVTPVRALLANSSRKINEMKAQLSKYSDNIDIVTDTVKSLLTKRDSLIEETKNANQIREEYNSTHSNYVSAVFAMNSAESNLKCLDNEILSLTNAIEDAKKEENDSSLQMAISRLATLQDDLETAKNDRTSYSEKIELCKYITYLCSDDGLKSYIIKMFVPYFNAAVEENLKSFNLPYHFVFDNTMDYKYSASVGCSPTYGMLSDGQKSKIGLAISMAFCDFVFMIANFRINCLFLDETLDKSTDDLALRDMVDLVRMRTQKTPVIIAVTHRAKIIQDLFDYKLNVNYNGLFSTIGECENVSANVN